jgi:hypothetical protein
LEIKDLDDEWRTILYQNRRSRTILNP